jgi:hypothetical protein
MRTATACCNTVKGHKKKTVGTGRLEQLAHNWEIQTAPRMFQTKVTEIVVASG